MTAVSTVVMLALYGIGIWSRQETGEMRSAVGVLTVSVLVLYAGASIID